MFRRYNLTPSYGAEIDAWIESIFAEWESSGNYACMDNLRIARDDDDLAQQRYEELFCAGCCGGHDVLLVGPDGHEYALGFNYGH